MSGFLIQRKLLSPSWRQSHTDAAHLHCRSPAVQLLVKHSVNMAEAINLCSGNVQAPRPDTWKAAEGGGLSRVAEKAFRKLCALRVSAVEFLLLVTMSEQGAHQVNLSFGSKKTSPSADGLDLVNRRAGHLYGQVSTFWIACWMRWTRFSGLGWVLKNSGGRSPVEADASTSITRTSSFGS